MHDNTTQRGDDLRSLIKKLQNVDVESVNENEALKIETLDLARKITAALEGPVNRATDLMYRPYVTIAARIAVDLDLFKHIGSASGAITSSQLADKSGGDKTLISRILRLLAALDFVENPEVDVWMANDETRALATPPIAAGHRLIYDVIISSAIKGPKYLRETKYKVSSEPTDSFLQYANQTKHSLWEHLETMPSLLKDFNLFMGNTMGAREYWHDWYDIQGRFLKGYDPSKGTPLLVDIGGGKGHDLLSFHNAFSHSENYSGNLVLEDLPQVLDSVPTNELSDGISKVAYDFFEEQPQKGARGYFLHHILHDWSDKYCHLILKRIHDAMEPGYSKLLIHELIIPETGATEIQARYDLVMMTFGGMERTGSQWTELLQQAGFVNIKVWTHFDHDGIVEAEIA